MTDLPGVDVDELADEDGRVYLWRIPEEWPAEEVDTLAEEINPRFDHAYHLFAHGDVAVEDISDRVEIVVGPPSHTRSRST